MSDYEHCEFAVPGTRIKDGAPVVMCKINHRVCPGLWECPFDNLMMEGDD